MNDQKHEALDENNYQIYRKYQVRFILYCVLFFLYGSVVNSLGPLFPYLAAEQHIPQTSYSILFIFRAIGYIIGCSISKIIGQKLQNSKFLSIACLFLAVSSILFTFIPSSLVYKGILMFISGWGCAMSNMFLHSAIIKIYQNQNLEWYLIVAHGVYGVGGLMGPIFVYLLRFLCYLVLGIGLLAISILFIKLQSIQNLKNLQNKQIPSQQKQQRPELNYKTALLMCPIFMLIVGQQTIYGGWISSFSVINNYTQKQKATIFSSLFWISITIFRFIFAKISGHVVYKLIGLFFIAFLASFGSLWIISINHIFGLYTSAVVFGFSSSVQYALGLALPQQYGLTLTTKQSSNIILSSAFGEGILAVLAGHLMGYFGPNAMFYFLGIMAILGLINVLQTVRQMKIQSKQKLSKNQQNNYSLEQNQMKQLMLVNK